MQRQSEVYLKVIYFCCCFCRVKRKWQIQAGCLRGLVKGCLPLWLDPCACEVQCLWRRLQQESKKPCPFLILRLPFTALSNFFFFFASLTSRFPYLTSSPDLVYLQPCHFLSQPPPPPSLFFVPQEKSQKRGRHAESPSNRPELALLFQRGNMVTLLLHHFLSDKSVRPLTNPK